ncbi:hypothetical protein [uncultured Clostridium sp.]|uniref:hypothetical protein n=1 Tax=uncultured Clostridium sp. TaxID=59620 RepID=UPI0028E5E88F|nr:hypothetical protein [uncultured Clostridium sp.]
MYKLDKLEQDISEVEGAIEDLESKLSGFFDSELKDLKDKMYIFSEDLKYHIETTKSFISDLR